MPFCPVCSAEYRLGFTRCNSCEVDLVAALPEHVDLSEESVRKALEGKELVAISRGFLDPILEMRELLGGQRIPSLVVESEEEVPKGMPKRVVLCVSQEHLEAAGRVLGENFRKMLDDEGISPTVANLQQNQCPACGEPVAEDQEECPECGLFVGKG